MSNSQLAFQSTGAASEHLQLQGQLLDKALAIHEVELTQALEAKKEQVRKARTDLIDKCDAVSKKIRESITKRIDLEWLNKHEPLVVVANAFTFLKGGGRKYKPVDLLENCQDEFEPWYNSNDNWYLAYNYRGGYSMKGYTAADVAKHPHTLSARINIRKKKIKLFIDLGVKLPSFQKGGDGSDERKRYTPWIDMTKDELTWATEINEELSLIDSYDVEVLTLNTRIEGVKAQADALKVQVFRKQIAQYQGGGDVLAMLDESIQASVEGKLPELLSI